MHRGRSSPAGQRVGGLAALAFSSILSCLWSVSPSWAVAGARVIETEVDTALELQQRGNQWYQRRAEGARGEVPAAEPIGRAVELLERALHAAPEDLSIRADLLRALLFRAEYLETDTAQKKAVFERGRQLFEEGLAQLEERTVADLVRRDPEQIRELLADEPAAGRFLFWGAVHYGLWGEYFGNLAAARKGLANRLLRYGEAARALEPSIDSEGPSRFLGRLHHLTPRIPFITRWADRDLAVELLGHAARKAPQEPLNHLFYAEALWDLRGENERALEILRAALERPVRPSHSVEDARARARVAELIARIED